MDVRMPDGTIVKNVPENITKSELMRRYTGAQEPIQEPVQETIETPRDQYSDLPSLRAQQMFLREGLAPAARQVSGVIGQGIGYAGRGIDALSGGRIGRGLEYLGQTPPAQAAARGLEYVGQKYGEFEEAMPETAQTLEDAAAVFQFMPGVAAVSKGKGFMGKPTYPDSQEIRKAAETLYSQARNTGASYTDDALTDFAKSMQTNLPKTELGRAVVGSDDFADTVNRFIRSAKDEVLDLDSFEDMDKALNVKYMKAVGAQDFDTARKFADAKGELRRIATSDKYLTGPRQGIDAYRDATNLWSAQARLREVEDIIEFASTYPQPQTFIKNSFRVMIKNPKNLKGYTPKQIEAIRKASRTGMVDDVLGTLGSRLVGIGGTVAGGPLGSALGMSGSMGARMAAQARKGAEATNIGRMIQEQALEVSPQLRQSVVANPRALVTTLAPAGAINYTAQELQEIMKLPPREAKKILENR